MPKCPVCNKGTVGCNECRYTGEVSPYLYRILMEKYDGGAGAAARLSAAAAGGAGWGAGAGGGGGDYSGGLPIYRGPF